MNVYTARQAILDRRNNVVGYELLYRDGELNSFPDIDPHQATSRLIVRTHFNQGLGALVDDKVSFINFSEKCLLSGFPKMLPSKNVVIEILETVRPTDEVYECCRELFHKGYRLALDDFVYKPEWNRFLKLVKIIKFDIENTPLASIAPLVVKLKELKKRGNLKNDIILLAERVETMQQYEQAKAMGFHLFQGYYFYKPEMKLDRDISIAHITLFNLYNEVCKKELNMKAIEDCFKSDEGLAYKLLVFMNSGIASATQPISSIKQALVYLGEDDTRKFLVLLTTTEMCKDKPPEIVRMGLIRAKTCEIVAKKVVPGLSKDAFLMGLLSILPSILERPIEVILKQIRVSDDIAMALAPPGKKETLLKIILASVLLIEKGLWHLTTLECMKLRLSYDQFCAFYQEAIASSSQYDNLLGSLDSSSVNDRDFKSNNRSRNKAA
jgi:EAL and modified HD-GYP domain-containing signal transduction protein